MSGDLRVGISGWTYGPWKGTFYPKNLSAKKELAYASRRLNSIEVNGTFYSLQRPHTFAAWHDAVPEDFLFAVKAPRYVTHIRRLKDSEVPVANFFASGVLRLGRKLGPILWQLPPSFRFGAEVLERFLACLPRDTREAARLAQRRDAWLADRSWFDVRERAPLRHALEVRHDSFRDPAFFRLLRRAKVALVTADTAGKWPLFEELTADFAYARLHGDEELYVSGYTPAALGRWAAKACAWRRTGRDVFVYFDNDAKVRAPFDAMALAKRLGLGIMPGCPAGSSSPIASRAAATRRSSRAT